jgi:hypothetical protein
LRGRGVELNKSSDELMIRVGSFEAHFVLPGHPAAVKKGEAGRKAGSCPSIFEERIMGKEEKEKPVFDCPVGRFFMDLERISGSKSKFHKHISQSRIEFLRAIRSLVDEKIDDLERKAAKRGKKKMTKIKVD